MKLSKRFLPLCFIVFVWFIFASPYFVKHLIPYPSRFQVSFFTPWNSYPQYAGPVKNNALSDVVDELYPWKHFTIETLKSRELPYWNPYSFSGTPHLANYQSAVLSPFNLLFFVFPFVDAWSILILLQPLLAGLFMYLFLKSLKISAAGGVMGGIAFMFCGFMVTWMAYGTMAMAAAFLPLILFVIEKNFQKQNIPLLIVLSIGLAISFLSGHFQVSLYVALFSGIYLIFKLFTTKNSKVFLWILVFYVLGLIACLPQILPTLQLYGVSARSGLFSNAGGIPLQYLVTIFAPDFFGNPVTRNDWYGYYAEWASFTGIIPLTLAVMSVFDAVSFFFSRDRTDASSQIKSSEAQQIQATHIVFFVCAAAMFLLLALDTPLQNLLTFIKVPVFSTSIPSRIIVLFSFSLIVLSAFGFDTLFRGLQSKQLKRLAPPVFLMTLLLSCIWVLLFLHVLPTDKAPLAVRNLLLPSFFFFVFLAVALLHYFANGRISTQKIRKNPLRSAAISRVLLWTIIILTMLDSLRFANKWIPFDPKSFVFPTVPVIAAMQKHSGQGRVYGDFGAYIDTYFHLPSIEGYDPLSIQRYADFLASAKTGTLTSAKKSLALLDRRAKYADRILDLLGVTLVYQPISYTNEPWGFPVWDEPAKYSVMYHDDYFQVFKNNTALPRVKLFYSYEVVDNAASSIKEFYRDSFDFRNVLLLENAPIFSSCQIQPMESCGNGSSRIVSYAPNAVTIFVKTDRPALLFLSDSYYPSWSVTVNGRPEKIYQADYAFRAVVVPAGKSNVKFFIHSPLSTF